MIEEGAQWPEPATYAKSAFLRKPDKKGDEMGDYRILTLTDPIYRVWAKTRCRELDPLFKFWGGEGLLSAAPGYGAADGHYDLALRIEQALVRLWPFGGRSN